MKISQYFKDAKGYGILATADSMGKVNAAIFARPHIMEEGLIAFIMPERLTHHNLAENPHAAYLFIEEGGGFSGVRLHLTKVREEKDSELLNSMRRVKYEGDEERVRYLVIFKIDRALPLIGNEGIDLEI